LESTDPLSVNCDSTPKGLLKIIVVIEIALETIISFFASFKGF
jgi:hypothetical protein